MWFPSWLRNRTVSRKQHPASRFRPQLEVLEDRAVPATLLVNTTLDVLGHNNGLLSLRQAIIDANATPTKADTIVLPAGNYTLTLAGASEDACLSGDLDISGPLTISGPGASSTVIDGGGLDRVFEVHSGSVSLSGMTIQGGYAPDAISGTGGGIFNHTGSMLTVSAAIISGNDAYEGGGIENRGTLTVNNSTLSGNTALTGGGGIFNEGNLSVNSSVLSSNDAGYGGGIANFYTCTVSSSTLSGNTAHRSWGGLGTLYGNGGGIFNDHKLTVSSSTLSNNSAASGGAIANATYQGGMLTVSNCTLAGNAATDFGGGIYNGANGKLTIRGSTVVGNLAPVGADLYNLGILSLSGDTIGISGP
jgi:hypothetical protein